MTNHSDHLWNHEERSLVEYRSLMAHQLFHEEKSGELIFILIFGESFGNYAAQNYHPTCWLFFRKLETNRLLEVNVARHLLICKTYCCKITRFSVHSNSISVHSNSNRTGKQPTKKERFKTCRSIYKNFPAPQNISICIMVQFNPSKRLQNLLFHIDVMNQWNT